MSMIQEKIEKAFERHHHIRALFFFDPEGVYKSEVDALEPNGYRVHEVGECFFTAKAMLARAWRDERVVLYLNSPRPATQEEKHAFPLLGELIAGRALELDDVGDFLEQFELDESARPLIAKWISELRLKLVQETCMDILRSGELNEPDLIRGMVSAFLELKRAEDWGVVAARIVLWFQTDRDKKWSSFRNRIDGLELTAPVVKQLSSATGLPLENLEDGSVQRWAEAMQYNRIVNGLNKAELDTYGHLKVANYESETRFRQFLQQVERHTLADRFLVSLDALGENIRGESLLAVYGATAPFGAMPNAMFWGFAKRLMKTALEQPSEARHTLSQQKYIPSAGTNQAHLRHFMELGVAFLASLPEGREEYTLNTVEDYTKRYTEDWHQLDRLYRQALYTFKAVDFTVASDELGEAARGLSDRIKLRYDDHVDSMNREWLKCLSEQAFEYKGLGVPLQSNFYAEHVQDSSTKVAVIISDAFRFEAARELLGVLHQDAKNTAKLDYCLASIPSRTSVGMAQLLPGPKRWVDGEIQAHDISTASTHRAQVLQRAHAHSTAIRAKDLDGMTKQEQREVFKHEVVYVYHDIIDSISDKRATEHLTFDNVQSAVEDLDRLVRLLHGSLNVRRVIVTADHGFLYTERDLADADLERVPVDNAFVQHNRFFLTNEKQSLPLVYSFPFEATTGIEAPVWVNIPVATNRYRVQGAGHRFVHGGGSLQELVVPVLESTRKREDVIERVKLSLPAPKSLKVVSSRMRVELFQEEPVSQLKKARTVAVGLYHPTSGELLSNSGTLQLDSTAERPSERMHTVDLTLGVHSGSQPTLKLRIHDVEDPLNPLEDLTITNHTLIEPDF